MKRNKSLSHAVSVFLLLFLSQALPLRDALHFFFLSLPHLRRRVPIVLAENVPQLLKHIFINRIEVKYEANDSNSGMVDTYGKRV